MISTSGTETRINGEDGPLPVDEELTHRFEFILTKSSLYAKTSLTIEQIAQHLAENDLTEESEEYKKGRLSREKPIDWNTRCKWYAAGMLTTMLGVGLLLGTWLLHRV
jgi:hypothetical protein